MTALFLKIVNMSISASYIVLAVLLLRLLFKRAPKWISVLLWGMVALRLACPFSFESIFSLIPSAEVVSPTIMTDRTPTINTGIPELNQAINPVIGGSFAPEPSQSINPLQIVIPVLAAVWVAGVIALLAYTVISCLRLKRRIGTAVLYRDNVYQSESVVSPFVLGIIKPKIYLPFNVNEKDIVHVIAHEAAHIRRKDHLWKPIGFLLLALHWFNPLMWLGYILLCRDIELACDEKVIKKLDRDARADYSEALLACSVNRRIIAACPLAFGEVGVKSRIKSVMKYKKPAIFVILAAIIACAVVTICLLTDPIDIENIGIKSFSAKMVDSDTVELKLKYSYPMGKYSVSYVSEDEGEYCADSMVKYDGSLGKYRILIQFGDTELSRDFKENFPSDRVFEVKNSTMKVRVKYASPSDHGVCIYVGFDVPVHVDQKMGELNPLGGSLKIPIKLLPSNQIYGSDYPHGSIGTDHSGVYVTIDSLYKADDGRNTFDVIWHNDTNKGVSYGNVFSIEYKSGEEWVDTSIDGKNYFTTEGYLLKEGKTATKSYTAEQFDMSKSGTYRFVVPFSVKEGNEYLSCKTWAEFKVVKTANDLSAEELNALMDTSIPAEPYGDVKEGVMLDSAELGEIIAKVPTDKYKVYPHLHSIPLTAILYKDGSVTYIDVADPRLIGLMNFFNNSIYNLKYAWTQGLLNKNSLERHVLNADFRLELTFTASTEQCECIYDNTHKYGKFIITNGKTASFTLINYDILGYQDDKEDYPYYAMGFYPLFDSYPWLELFGL